MLQISTAWSVHGELWPICACMARQAPQSEVWVFVPQEVTHCVVHASLGEQPQ
jgi:hypothetical protein